MTLVEEFVKFLEGISKEERRHLETFTKRISVLHDHKVLVRGLCNLLNDLKKSPGDKGIRKKIEATLSKISKEVLSAFEDLGIKELKSVVEAERARVRKQVSVRLHDAEDLRKAFAQGKEKAISKLIAQIEKEIGAERAEEDALEHVSRKLDELKLVHEELRSELSREIELLKRTRALVQKETDPDSVQAECDTLVYQWQHMLKSISDAVRKERAVMDHLGALFKKKFKVQDIVHRHLAPRRFLGIFKRSPKITKDDIARDVSMLTSADEFLRYQTALLNHWEFLTPQARRFIQLGGLSAAKKFGEQREKLEVAEKEKVKLKSLIFIDERTGLYNVRAWEERFAEYKSYADRTGTTFSLAWFDIDNFGKFNEIYGHETSNDVLEFVASVIISSVRKSDMVFRWGGEEIVVLLPGLSKDRAYVLADRVRKAIQEKSRQLMVKLNKKKGLSGSDRAVDEITVSGAVVEYRVDGVDRKQLENRLSVLTKKAKSQGKNRIFTSNSFAGVI
ncbi:GGDEF domain-containing protein [Candidatus Woesearchaeota archaeon]|nr:MAG: GGDEF domain-containing protein [Candidatus Woesearchaeota archaeon]